LETTELLKACTLFAVGQLLGWFQINSQFVWEWWADKPLLTVFIYSIPASLCFWYGIGIAYRATGEVWGPRLLIYSMSYFTFPILTWYLLNESMFTAKTMLCIFLSFLIMAIQLFWE